MRILVLATDYPHPNGSVKLQYIHSRNQQYVEQGMYVSVISFASDIDYVLDGVNVYSLKTYKKLLKHECFDLLISHAPNLRHHYRFLKRYGHLYRQFVFFFHGHEVLKMTEVYPKSYDYMGETPVQTQLKQQLYDIFKLQIWRQYFRKVAYKSQFVFVSEWMHRMFLESVAIAPSYIQDRSSIIYNGVGKVFEEEKYDIQTPKPYDFITIRDNLDGSKYAIDIVTKIAIDNPDYQFCVIGKGQFFNHTQPPRNLHWVDRVLRHDEVIAWLNQAKCALLPTRLDSQGVMACEMATFGIPLITSDISVCTEVLADFDHVGYISNEASQYDIGPLFESLTSSLTYPQNTRYLSENTIQKEVRLFQQLVK